MSRIDASALQQLMNQDVRTMGYILEDRIGYGAFADVYFVSGNHIRPGSTVIKVIDVKENYQRLHQWDHFDAGSFQRFLKKSEREFQLIQKVYQNNESAPHLVSIEKAIEMSVNDNYYILLFIPYFPGTLDTLSELLSFDEDFVIDLGIQCASGPAQLQKHGIIHRDIKPNNIFFHRKNGKTIFQISDYGMCCTVEENSSQAKATSTLIATQFFAAPEAMFGQYSYATDTYSLGMILYWLCNEYYTHFSDKLNMLLKTQSETLPRMKYGSDGLWKIIEKAVSFRPENRYQSADEMLSDLRKLQLENEAKKPEIIIRNLQTSLHQKEQNIDHQEKRIDSLKQENAKLTEANQILQKTIQQSLQEKANLQKLLQDKEQQITQLKKEISDLQKKNQELLKASSAQKVVPQIQNNQEIWTCSICGYRYEGKLTDDFKCPVCASKKDKFQASTSYKENQPAYPKLPVPLSDTEKLCYHAWLYDIGLTVPKNKEKAIELYQKAHQHGSVEATYRLGIINLGDIHGKMDSSKGIDYLNEAASRNNTKALTTLANYYEHGWYGLKTDKNKAEALLKKAVQLGDVDAMCDLALYYYFTDNIPDHLKKSEQLYQKAVDLGSFRAMNLLAEWYIDGNKFLKNMTKAIQLLEKIIQDETRKSRYYKSEAYYLLGELYENGNGVKQDINTAKKYYQLASENYMTWTTQSVNKIWYSPKETYIPLRDQEMLKYLEQGYKDKNTYSIYSLGLMYEMGIGVEKDISKALELYQKAIDLDKYNSSAYIRLGLLYEQGSGVKKNLDKAKEYYQKANYNIFAKSQLALIQLGVIL